MRTVRQSAARALLAVFLLTAQAGPVAHLVTHRPDHTHGPELPQPAGAAEAAHAAAHAAGAPHAHDDAAADATREELTWLFPDEDTWLGAAGHAHGPAGQDHGRDSVSHFGVALLQAPPPPLVPAPAEALASPPDSPLAWHAAPALPHPPSRGPPVRRS